MTTSSPSVALLDTNILVYNADASSGELHLRSKSLIERGLKGELSLCVTPQVISEFFAIITDSRRVKKPISPKEAIEEIEKYLRSQNIQKIYADSSFFPQMLALLRKYETTRQDIFDLQLAATMLCNNVRKIYTYNQDDFTKFEEIEVLSPSIP